MSLCVLRSHVEVFDQVHFCDAEIRSLLHDFSQRLVLLSLTFRNELSCLGLLDPLSVPQDLQTYPQRHLRMALIFWKSDAIVCHTA